MPFGDVVIAVDAHLAEERAHDQRTPPHGPELWAGLVGAIELIDPLLEQGFEELATRREQSVAEHLFPREQAQRLGRLQERLQESLDFFLECRL